jgi:hypothetical protein
VTFCHPEIAQILHLPNPTWPGVVRNAISSDATTNTGLPAVTQSPTKSECTEIVADSKAKVF